MIVFVRLSFEQLCSDSDSDLFPPRLFTYCLDFFFHTIHTLLILTRLFVLTNSVIFYTSLVFSSMESGMLLEILRDLKSLPNFTVTVKYITFISSTHIWRFF